MGGANDGRARRRKNTVNGAWVRVEIVTAAGMISWVARAARL